jgi:hypothetical protein
VKPPRLWQMHGLLVRCDDVALDAREAAPTEAAADVTFRLATERPVLARGETPDGRVMSSLDLGRGAALTVVSVDEGTHTHRIEAHFHDLAVATLDPGGTKVEVSLAEGSDPALAAILIAGTLMSIVLVVRGHPVLHASAVTVGTQRGERAIAFVGSSGMGKSTMATLLCRDGARLLADDVLRTDVDPEGAILAWPGATATRLRAGAEPLAQETAERLTPTADGRWSAELDLARGEPVPLAALVVPQPDRGSDELTLTRIAGASAVLTLAKFPRILGWTDPETAARAHRHWGEIVRRVPVLAAAVPWGPPFPPRLGFRVTEAVLAAADDRSERPRQGG